MLLAVKTVPLKTLVFGRGRLLSLPAVGLRLPTPRTSTSRASPSLAERGGGGLAFVEGGFWAARFCKATAVDRGATTCSNAEPYILERGVGEISVRWTQNPNLLSNGGILLGSVEHGFSLHMRTLARERVRASLVG